MSNPTQDPVPTNHAAAVNSAPATHDDLTGLSGLDSTGNLGPMAFESVFPEFFEHIMMPFDGHGTTDNVARPPDVSNYTQDLNFGAADLEGQVVLAAIGKAASLQRAKRAVLKA